MDCCYLRSILVILLLSTFTDVSAQFSVYPFEDYAKCKTGFLRNKRDTVFPAKFENLLVVQLPTYVGENSYVRKKAWILSENNKFGCLNENGKWMVPCIYDNVEFNSLCSQFIVKQNGKFGLLSARKDSVLLPIEYDRIFPELSDNTFYGSMLVKKGKLLGLYNEKGKLVIEPSYEKIDRIYLRAMDYSSSISFFVVERDGKMGLVSETGEVILEPIYNEVRLFEEESSADWNTLFYVEDTLRRRAIFTKTGKQLLPFGKEHLEPAYTLRAVAENQSVAFAYREDSIGRHQMVSLSTGKTSGWNQQMNFMGDNIYVYNAEKWVILDTSFNTVYWQRKPTDELYLFDYQNDLRDASSLYMDEREEWYGYSQQLSQSYRKSNLPPIFVIRRVVPFSKREKERYDQEVKEYYGLINVEAGTGSPVIYSEIRRMGTSKGIYYWAISNKIPYDDEEITVDVYDSSGVYLRTACLDRFEYRAMHDFSDDNYSYRYDPFIVAKNREHKFGVRLLNGIRTSDYVLETEPHLFGMTTDSTGVYLMYDYESSGKHERFFVDFQGKSLLDGRRFDVEQGETWEDYGLPPPELETLQNDGKYTFVNRKLEVLLDSCSAMYVSIPGLKLNKSSYRIGIKNDCIYVYNEGEFHLLDSTFFVQPSVRNMVSSAIYVDSHGKWMREEAKKIPVKPNTNLYGNCYFTFQDNVLKVEDLKHKPVQTIPNVRTFYHQNGILTVYTTDTLQGLLDSYTGKWLLQPKYYEAKPFGDYQKDKFWAKEKLGRWFIVNQQGEKLTQPIFDYPVSMNSNRSWFLFSSNLNIGVMSTTYQIIVEPTYTKQWKLDQRDVLVKDGQFYFINPETGIPFRVDRPFVNLQFSQGLLFLSTDSIQILSFTGKELLPVMSITEASANVNLINYLEPSTSTRELPFIHYGNIYAAQSDTLLWRLNNQHLIEEAKNRVATLNEWMKKDTKWVPPCSLTPLWISKTMYSEMVSGSCYMQETRGTTTESKRQYRNYFITKTGLVPMKLSDLFLPESNYMQHLDSLLEKQIQEKQFFGPTCIDMPGAIEEFKRGFYLNEGFIFFEHQATGSMVRFPLKEFEGMMK